MWIPSIREGRIDMGKPNRSNLTIVYTTLEILSAEANLSGICRRNKANHYYAKRLLNILTKCGYVREVPTTDDTLVYIRTNEGKQFMDAIELYVKIDREEER